MKCTCKQLEEATMLESMLLLLLLLQLLLLLLLGGRNKRRNARQTRLECQVCVFVCACVYVYVCKCVCASQSSTLVASLLFMLACLCNLCNWLLTLDTGL